MDYTVLPFGAIWGNGIFNIPNDLVDRYLNLATENQLKALLLVMRNGGQASSSYIAKMLKVDTATADDLLEFWCIEGVIACKDKPVSEPEKKERITVIKQAPEVPRLSPRDIVEFMRRDEQNTMLMNEAEVIKGRSLGEGEKSAIANMVDFYGLNHAVILMLLQFYFSEKGRGKVIANGYLLKMAANWANDGVATISDAEVKLAQIEKSDRLKNEVRAITGIMPKTAKQGAMIEEWFKDFDVTMITLAFDTMKKDIASEDMAIIEPSLAYMNSILKRWKKYSITNPAQLQDYLDELEQKQMQGKKSDKLKRKPTYDINAINKYAKENTEI